MSIGGADFSRTTSAVSIERVLRIRIRRDFTPKLDLTMPRRNESTQQHLRRYSSVRYNSWLATTSRLAVMRLRPRSPARFGLCESASITVGERIHASARCQMATDRSSTKTSSMRALRPPEEGDRCPVFSVFCRIFLPPDQYRGITCIGSCRAPGHCILGMGMVKRGSSVDFTAPEAFDHSLYAGITGNAQQPAFFKLY